MVHDKISFITVKLQTIVKQLCKDRNRFRYIPPNSNFDYLPTKSKRSDPKAPTKNDILISLFNDFIGNHSEYKNQLPIITETLLQTVLKTINMKVRGKEIVDLIMKRYALIHK